MYRKFDDKIFVFHRISGVQLQLCLQVHRQRAGTHQNLLSLCQRNYLICTQLHVNLSRANKNVFNERHWWCSHAHIFAKILNPVLPNTFMVRRLRRHNNSGMNPSCPTTPTSPKLWIMSQSLSIAELEINRHTHVQGPLELHDLECKTSREVDYIDS